METKDDHTAGNPYGPGHPWYYVLGGKPPMPSEIRKAVIDRGYRGYRDDIDKVEGLPEPRRSHTLRKIRSEVLRDFWYDVSGYRKRVREYRTYRSSMDQHSNRNFQCSDIHVNLSLKHNHLFNGFGHLVHIEALLSRQLDLFESFD